MALGHLYYPLHPIAHLKYDIKVRVDNEFSREMREALCPARLEMRQIGPQLGEDFLPSRGLKFRFILPIHVSDRQATLQFLPALSQSCFRITAVVVDRPQIA
jgi:hypothetical protein